MWLMARWRAGLGTGPALVAVTVDHGFRAEAAAEARGVARLAHALGVGHRTLQWTGRKPATGLQEAARLARYRLLAEAARAAGAPAIVTAHTQDDQAETVLFRMARGSGLTGLAGMRSAGPLPGGAGLRLLRPFLSVPKARLVATLAAASVTFAEDPSNRDPRFARPRLRTLLPALAEEGLDAERLALLADRLARAEAALAAAADAACAALVIRQGRRLVLPSDAFLRLPDEIGLRVLGRVVAEAGDEGPAALGKLETLHAGLRSAFRSGSARFRRSLAGALVTLTAEFLAVERAPPRRSRALTTGRGLRRTRPENAVEEAG
jgi:tRNA(Ile)-lysidine synthase